MQLDAGVRLLTGQVHNPNNTRLGEWHLCHSHCELYNAGRLSSWLSLIKTWLDGHPREVVTILLVNADGASAADLAGQFSAAGIEDYAYRPPSITQRPQAWPTLEALIAANTRLMVFIASLEPASNTVAPYLMDEFTFIFENSYRNNAVTDFSCTPDRPSGLGTGAQAIANGYLPLMNHFVYESNSLGIQQPNVNTLQSVNSQNNGTGNLGERSRTCAQEWGRNPTFVMVDFFNVGPAIASVDAMNGVSNPVGRTAVTAEVLSADNPGSAAPSVDNSGSAVEGSAGALRRSWQGSWAAAAAAGFAIMAFVL